MISIEECFSFSKNDVIVIGCSAGPDSMALVHMLLKIREKYSLNLIVAHVNHNLRKQSVQEENYLRDYCDKYQEQKSLEKKLISLKNKEKKLKVDANKLQDPDYIARYAREKYLYSKDGEFILKIPEE